jgi:hypothetical protein
MRWKAQKKTKQMKCLKNYLLLFLRLYLVINLKTKKKKPAKKTIILKEVKIVYFLTVEGPLDHEGLIDEGLIDEGLIDEGLINEGLIDEGLTDDNKAVFSNDSLSCFFIHAL